MVNFCLLERWLVNPAVLLSAAASEELLRSSSSSLRLASRYSLCLRTAMLVSDSVENCSSSKMYITKFRVLLG